MQLLSATSRIYLAFICMACWILIGAGKFNVSETQATGKVSLSVPDNCTRFSADTSSSGLVCNSTSVGVNLAFEPPETCKLLHINCSAPASAQGATTIACYIFTDQSEAAKWRYATIYYSLNVTPADAGAHSLAGCPRTRENCSFSIVSNSAGSSPYLYVQSSSTVGRIRITAECIHLSPPPFQQNAVPGLAPDSGAQNLSPSNNLPSTVGLQPNHDGGQIVVNNQRTLPFGAWVGIGVAIAVTLLAILSYCLIRKYRRNVRGAKFVHTRGRKAVPQPLHALADVSLSEAEAFSTPSARGHTSGATSLYRRDDSTHEGSNYLESPDLSMNLMAFPSGTLATRPISALQLTLSECKAEIDLPANWEVALSCVKLYCDENGQPKILGSGAFGNVYYGAVHREAAAIKAVHGDSSVHRASLLREIRFLQQCSSRYIVQFLGYSIYRKDVLLIMEYMKDGTLRQALNSSQTYSWYGRGREAMLCVAKGLSFLASKHLAHGDLKSPNILLSGNDIKIADVGLGKLVHGPHVTASSIGTFAWAAPEQLCGRIGVFSDIWSMGVCLWEVHTSSRKLDCRKMMCGKNTTRKQLTLGNVVNKFIQPLCVERSYSPRRHITFITISYVERAGLIAGF